MKPVPDDSKSLAGSNDASYVEIRAKRVELWPKQSFARDLHVITNILYMKWSILYMKWSISTHKCRNLLNNRNFSMKPVPDDSKSLAGSNDASYVEIRAKLVELWPKQSFARDLHVIRTNYT